MPRIRAHANRDPNMWDANQVVAYNFKLARKKRGWTQDETAEHLEVFLGQRLKKTSISAIERSVDSDRRRVFTSQELVAFSLTFEVSILWFLLPPPDPEGEPPRRLEGYNGPLIDLVGILLGRENEQEAFSTRVEALAKDEQDRDRPDVKEHLSHVAKNRLGFGLEVSWEHFEAYRRDLLLDMVLIERDRLETLFDGMKDLVETFDETRRSMALSAEYPRRAYRNISEILLGESVYGAIRNEFRPTTRSSLLDVVDRNEIPWDDIIDTTDPAVTEAIQNLAHAIEPKARAYLDKVVQARTWASQSNDTGPHAGESGEALSDTD